MESAANTTSPDGVVIVRDETGRFLPGTIPPVRQKGGMGGRALALKTLDVMLGKDKNQENLMNALQAHFDVSVTQTPTI